MSTSETQASLIGVAIACAGNILISLALTVQKLAHQRRDAESKHGSPARVPVTIYGATRAPAADPHALYSALESQTRTPNTHSHPTGPHLPSHPSPPPSHSPTAAGEAGYLRSRLWWLGLGLMALGEAGNFLSYGFAPASVVAPLGTVALIANGVFAPLILGESFTKRNVLGVALAILGAVTIVWSSRNDNKRLSPDELLAAITALPFVTYTAITFSLITPLTFLSSGPWGDRYVIIDVGLVALFGGYTVMATKALSSLLSRQLILALEYPIAWGAIVVIVVTSVLQIKFLNRALMRFESKEVIPTQFVFFSLSAIIGSAVLYQEFHGVSRSDFVNFAFGVATTFLGVYFLTTPAETAALPVDEEAALTLAPERRISTGSALSMPHPGLPVRTPHTGPDRQSLRHRASQPNIDIGLAVNSPAGLYLLATTPPITTPVLATAATMGRQRGMSTDSGINARNASRHRSASTVNRVLEGLIRK